MKIVNITNETINQAKQYVNDVLTVKIWNTYGYNYLYDVVERWYKENKSLSYQFRLAVLATAIARGLDDQSIQLPSNDEVRRWLPIVYKATKKRTPLKVVYCSNRYNNGNFYIYSLFTGKGAWKKAPECECGYDVPSDVYGVYDAHVREYNAWCKSHIHSEHCMEYSCAECFDKRKEVAC